MSDRWADDYGLDDGNGTPPEPDEAEVAALAEGERAILKSIVPESQAPGCHSASFWSGAAAALLAVRAAGWHREAS